MCMAFQKSNTYRRSSALKHQMSYVKPLIRLTFSQVGSGKVRYINKWNIIENAKKSIDV